MIIQPKITWLHYLTIGIKFKNIKIDQMKIFIRVLKFYSISIGIIALTFSSCDGGHQIDYNLTTNFIYKNLTSENVEIILFDDKGVNFKNYIIEPNQELKLKENLEGARNGLVPPFIGGNGLNFKANQLKLKFLVTNKCVLFSRDEGMLNVLSYDNYSVSMNNNSNNTLIYNIDSVELNNATNCL